MAFSQAKTLILRPEIDSGSKFHLLLGDVHAAACGLKMNGPAGPFILSQGFCQLGFSSRNYCMFSFPERMKQKAIG
jgi:hypothetical protein